MFEVDQFLTPIYLTVPPSSHQRLYHLPGTITRCRDGGIVGWWSSIRCGWGRWWCCYIHVFHTTNLCRNHLVYINVSINNVTTDHIYKTQWWQFGASSRHVYYNSLSATNQYCDVITQSLRHIIYEVYNRDYVWADLGGRCCS